MDVPFSIYIIIVLPFSFAKSTGSFVLNQVQVPSYLISSFVLFI